LAKFRTSQNSFVAGEISPTAMGRIDIPQYAHACKTMKNMIPWLSGGAYRRPGSFYEDGHTFTVDYAPRLIPFVASQTEVYCVSFYKIIGGNGVANVYRPTANNATSTKTAVTGTHPYRVPAAATSATLGVNDEIRDVKFVQQVDVMHLVHPKHKPRRLTRTAADTFALTTFDNGLATTALRDANPYRKRNVTAITMTIDIVTVGTGRVLTASAAFFNANHVGALFKVFDGGVAYGACVVTGFTSSTQVTVEVIVAFGDLAAHTTWWESSWSDYRGWPRAVSFYKNRIAYHGNTSEPDTTWFGQSNNNDVMSVSTIIDPNIGGNPTGSQPFQAVLASEELNLIQWAKSGDTLLIGTLGDEWIISPTDPATGFGADNASADRQSSFGSAYITPARVGNEVVVCSTSKSEVRALIFNDLEKSYTADPIQLLYDEKPQVDLINGERAYRDIAWDKDRSTLWCHDTRGNLFGLTHDRRLQVNAWHSHEMGGFNASETSSEPSVALETDPVYKNCSGSIVSLAVVPNPVNGVSDIWLCVKRKINSVWKYHIERIIGRNYEYDTAYASPGTRMSMYHVDAAIYRVFTFGVDVWATDVLGGVLDHIEGKTPEGTVFNTDGIVTIKASAVSSGDSTLTSPEPDEVSIVTAGLPYQAVIIPVRPEAGSVIGTAQGAKKRIHEATLRVYRSLACKLGQDASHLEKVYFRSGSTLMGQSPELFTGDKAIKATIDYGTDQQLYILADKALPFAITSLVMEGVTYDG